MAGSYIKSRSEQLLDLNFMFGYILTVLLFPFACIYSLVTTIRNYLYDKGTFKSFKFDVKTIGVGNLRVGGTGKTPHVEYLIELLKSDYTIATLSRGYGRSTRGFILADETSDAQKLGDEPMQFYSKYGNEVAVAVGEERVEAIPQILAEREEVNLILLDDAYQHRPVNVHVNILLSEYYRPFFEDFVLPAGRLRESRKGAGRADMVIITKCPDKLTEAEMNTVCNKVNPYIKNSTPVFFTGIKYKKPLPVFDTGVSALGRNIILVSGIANAGLLEKEIQKTYNLVKHYNFKDHYDYNKSDLERIIKHFHETGGNDTSILLTEKDMVKWKKKEFEELFHRIPVFYLPVEIHFLRDKAKFDELIARKLREV